MSAGTGFTLVMVFLLMVLKVLMFLIVLLYHAEIAFFHPFAIECQSGAARARAAAFIQ
jgi:hypothetical protein